MGTYSGSCFKAIDFSYQVSVSKPNALVLGCRHRLIVLDHKSEKYLAFPLKCGMLLIALLVEIFTLAAKQGLYQHRVKRERC